MLRLRRARGRTARCVGFVYAETLPDVICSKQTNEELKQNYKVIVPMTNHYEAFVLLELQVCLRLFLVCLGGFIAASWKR